MNSYKVALLPGDGIGPEVISTTVTVLNKVSEKYNFTIDFTQGLIGGAAIDQTNKALPDKTLELCKKSDAVLMGAVGGPQWDNLKGEQRPERGLLAIRAELGLFANLRPAIVYEALEQASPLKTNILQNGLDILVVRELTGGIYFGRRGRDTQQGIPCAFDTECYNITEIERIGKVAFESAIKRNKKVCSIDKANVLESSRLWRETITNMSKTYPQVKLSHMYVDNAAMQLIRDPKQFDVIVTNNIFGDILSDEASQITGSIGMLPSASLGDGKLGLYEPVHGSAPDIAGQNIANPLATILSGAMMLRYSLGEIQAAEHIEFAVEQVLNQGYRCADLYSLGGKLVSTTQMGEKVINAIN